MLFNNTNMRTAMAYTNAVGDKVYPIIVDIKKGIKSTEEVSFVSSDINTGVLSVAFIQGNDTYNVEGAEVICSIMRPDTTTLEIPCNAVNGNTIEVPLGVNGTSQDGVYSFDFKVFKGGNKIVGTPIMNYSVSLSISNDLVVEEDDRLPVLTMLITQVNELKEETRETINQANVATEASKEATANAIDATNNANAVSERVSQETATAISEIKQDTANAIASMNQSTNDSIASMTQKTNEAVIRVNDNLTNINNTVATKVAELDTAKSDMTTTVSNKIDEVENRFNALTSSQQQDAEVVDARDGETSLKARLDRDIEKANKELDKIKKLEENTVSTVTTESDFTTVEATSNGYFEDVKLEGKTLVNLNNFKKSSSLSDRVRWENNDTKNIQGGVTVWNLSDKPISVDVHHLDTDTYKAWYNVSSNSCKVISIGNNEKVGAVIGLFVNGWTSSELDKLKKSVIILEGDHTQNPPSGYIEGLKSVGDGVDEIVVSSVKGDGNLFDSTLDTQTKNGVTFSYDGATGEIVLNGTCTENNTCVMFKYPPKFIKGNTYYLRIFGTTINSPLASIRVYDDKYVGNNLATTSIGTSIHNSSSTRKMVNTSIRVDSGVTFNNFRFKVQLTVNEDRAEYIPHKSDKKRLLYYNEETQTWEKPILREWDSIEKHSDGKYYYHQRSGEVVLDGSEDESWWDTSEYGSEGENTLVFRGNVSNILRNLEKNNLVCDKFNFVASLWIKDIEGICCVENNSIDIRILKSKLSTQDVQGFKQWVQANNVTVVYQLAEEKIYECTNIDLITYANETNYIVESGAISPKSILKVHNNISNVVKILQEKVSLLESNVKASQEVQDMMILETDMRMLDIELALMEFVPMKLNLGGSDMLRSATYFNFLKNHIINETYEKEYLENVMNKYLATGRINQDEYDELYKMLYPPVYDIELPIEP